MTDILDLLSGQLGGDALGTLSQQLGSNPQSTNTAVQAALPILLGALSRNAAQPGGADALSAALDKDHDGSVLDDVAGFLGGSDAGPGAGILGHLLGAQQPAVESGLGRATGMDAAQISKLLISVAPLVLGVLGKQKREQNLNSGGLADLLSVATGAQSQRNPALGALGALLDRDGDGNFVDDLGSMLGGFLKR